MLAVESSIPGVVDTDIFDMERLATPDSMVRGEPFSSP